MSFIQLCVEFIIAQTVTKSKNTAYTFRDIPYSCKTVLYRPRKSEDFLLFYQTPFGSAVLMSPMNDASS